MLTTTNHSRDSAGLTYVYPVISRRSGGLSIGVNLNPNNACNWRCLYCQVPDLTRGGAPATDLGLLEKELRGFLDDVLFGNFFQRFDVPLEQRVIRDIAISGNGEPTSAAEFDRVVELIGEVAFEYGLLEILDSNHQQGSKGSNIVIENPLPSGEGRVRAETSVDTGPVAAKGCRPTDNAFWLNSTADLGDGRMRVQSPAVNINDKIKLVLITNGSLVRREAVQKGLARWGELGGEVWFKLDSAIESGIQRINGVHLAPATVLRNLATAAGLCPTWLQTCLFAFDGQPPIEEEQQAYLDFLNEVQRRRIPLRGVLLYGLARPSMQAEAPRLSALSAEWMDAFAEEIRKAGVETKLSL